MLLSAWVTIEFWLLCVQTFWFNSQQSRGSRSLWYYLGRWCYHLYLAFYPPYYRVSHTTMKLESVSYFNILLYCFISY